MKQTIVAIMPPEGKEWIERYWDNRMFLAEAQMNGELLTLKEFQERYNADEINFNNTLIRFIEVNLQVIGCK